MSGEKKSILIQSQANKPWHLGYRLLEMTLYFVVSFFFLKEDCIRGHLLAVFLLSYTQPSVY